MSEMSIGTVTLGADVGGKDAHEATQAHVLRLRRLLANECSGPYSETIKEIALVLRIDGSVQAWGKSGVSGVKLQKKNSFATADIYVPRDVWASHDPSVFREFLASEVKAAIVSICETANRRGVVLLRDELERDVYAAAQSFILN